MTSAPPSSCSFTSATPGLGMALALALALVMAGCGDDAESAAGPIIVRAGEVDIQLPDGFELPSDAAEGDGAAGDAVPTPTTTATTGSVASATTSPSRGPGAAAATTTTAPETEETIPVNESEEPAASRLLKAVGRFNACLDDEGIEFIGAPSPDNPATQDPLYLEGLGTCAARSNIVQALSDAQAENDSLTPEEIEERNEGYLIWRDCMIERGWGIPEPVPDEQGRLFSFGGGGNTGIVAPPGESLLDSGDLNECADESTRQLADG